MSVRHTKPREELLPPTAERRGSEGEAGIGRMSRPGEEARPADRGWSDRVINIQSTPDRANNFLPSST